MFLHVYDLSAKLTFATSEHLAVFFELSGFHDHALRSLVRQKMLTVFKPKVRQAIMRDTSQGKVGLFGGDQVVIDKITESKKRFGTICSAVLMPAASKSKYKYKNKYKTKTGAKGASSKDGEVKKIQRLRSPRTPLPASDTAKNVLDDEVQGLLSNNAVKEVKPMLEQYVSLYILLFQNLKDPMTNVDPFSI